MHLSLYACMYVCMYICMYSRESILEVMIANDGLLENVVEHGVSRYACMYACIVVHKCSNRTQRNMYIYTHTNEYYVYI
jgi:hypothetical protein